MLPAGSKRAPVPTSGLQAVEKMKRGEARQKSGPQRRAEQWLKIATLARKQLLQAPHASAKQDTCSDVKEAYARRSARRRVVWRRPASAKKAPHRAAQLGRLPIGIVRFFVRLATLGVNHVFATFQDRHLPLAYHHDSIAWTVTAGLHAPQPNALPPGRSFTTATGPNQSGTL